jgi:lipoprotein-releasing system ATP-binding protein
MLIEIEQIHKSYGAPGTPSERKVLNGFSLSVDQGEALAITGPSGSGKTTLLNLIAALDRPDSGRILFKGTDIATLASANLDRFRSQSVGLVFQFHHLLPQCTLMENVLVPALAGYRTVPPEIVAHGERLVRRMGLWDVRNQKPGELSGGECQRAAVARALINNPMVLLADEPTGALDHANAVNLINLLEEISREHSKTLILVTHSAEIAARMGRIVQL